MTQPCTSPWVCSDAKAKDKNKIAPSRDLTCLPLPAFLQWINLFSYFTFAIFRNGLKVKCKCLLERTGSQFPSPVPSWVLSIRLYAACFTASLTPAAYTQRRQTHPEGHGALTVLEFKPDLSQEFDGGLDGPQLLRNQPSLSQKKRTRNLPGGHCLKRRQSSLLLAPETLSGYKYPSMDGFQR